MARVAVRESVTLAGRAERARTACAFVGGLLGTGHPCGDTAVLLAAVWQKCPVQRLGRSRETVTVAIRTGDGVVRVED
jgi:ribosome biogenesis SPOUT family RNA methylase Rps3